MKGNPMKQFVSIDPELAQFLFYDGPNLSAEIGDEYKDVEIELVKGDDGVYR